MKTRFLFLCIAIIACYSCNENHLGSDMPKLLYASDSSRVDELNELSWEASATQFNKALKLADSALQLSKHINYTIGIGKSYSRIALAYDYNGSYDTAFIYYSKAVNIFEQSNNKIELAKAFNNIGASYYCRAKYIEATKYYLKSLSIREELKDKKGIAQSLNNIGLLYRIQKNYPKAIEYYKKSIKIRDNINDSVGILYAEQNLAVAFEKSMLYDSALNHYHRAIYLATILNDSISLGANLSNACILNKNTGNFKLAIEQAEQSEAILRQTNEKHILTQSIGTYADLYLKTQHYNKALQYAKEGLEMSLALNYHDLTQSFYFILSQTYAQLNNYSKAYTYHSLYSSIKDSVLNTESSQQLKELQTKYETTKKEKQIATLTIEKTIESQRKSLAVGLAALLLLLIIIGYLIHNQHKIKSKELALSLQQRMLRSQMNPHFIFNALGSIQSFVFYNKKDDAINYLSKFAALMRDILDGSVNDLISVEQDVEIINNYLELQKLRYESKFDFIIENKIDIPEVQLPPMLTQPFIENSIKHGFTTDTNSGLINVNYQLNNKQIRIEIIDNGIGYYNSKPNSTKHKSHAIKITKKRLSIKGKRSHVELISPIKDNRGTKVIITLPAIFV